MEKWKVRLYQEGDEAGIVELMNLIWPEFEYTFERWLWEYKNNPFGHITVVAESKGEIVGHAAVLPVDMKFGDRIIRAAQCVDLVVHPDFRRQGIYMTLMKTWVKKATEEGILILYVFTPDIPFRALLKYGYFEVCRIPELITCLDTYNVIRRKYYRLGKISLMKYFSEFVDFFFSARRNRSSKRARAIFEQVKTFEVSSFDERMDKFWSRVSDGFATGVVRDAKYLNWRYSKKPASNYKAILAERDNLIEGYLILSVNKSRNRREGYIVDALASSIGIGRNLFQLAIRYFVEERVNIIKCLMLKDFFWYPILKENGFTNILSKGARFAVRINSPRFFKFPRNSSGKCARAWYLTYGDWDVV